MPDFASLR
jgi:putative DNA primase/helicase